MSVSQVVRADPLFRFFKIFLPLDHVRSYKRLKSIHFLAERENDFKENAYEWDLSFFGPDSSGLQSDIINYTSPDWLLVFPYFGWNQRIHHQYLMSPACYTELLQHGRVKTIVEELKQTVRSYKDFVSKLLVWNSVPVSWMVGMSIVKGERYETRAEPKQRHVLTNRDTVFDQRLVDSLYKFYATVFTESKVELVEKDVDKQKFSISIRSINPEKEVSRYYHLIPTFSQDEIARTGRFFKKRLREPTLFPYEVFKGANVEKEYIEAKFDDTVQEFLEKRDQIQSAVEGLLADLRELYRIISGDTDGITLKLYNDSVAGVAEIELPSRLESDLSSRKDYSAQLWNMLQPIEVSRLLKRHDLDWLLKQIIKGKTSYKAVLEEAAIEAEDFGE